MLTKRQQQAITEMEDNSVFEEEDDSVGIQDDQNESIKIEHHIVYSTSYQVPVMYFQAFFQGNDKERERALPWQPKPK